MGPRYLGGPRASGWAAPSKHMVEKKAMLRVSKGESWVHSGDLVWGSDSPVNDELSTWRWREEVGGHFRACPTLITQGSGPTLQP